MSESGMFQWKKQSEPKAILTLACSRFQEAHSLQKICAPYCPPLDACPISRCPCSAEDFVDTLHVGNLSSHH